MPARPIDALTALLLRWRQGDKEALDQLLPVVYEELRRLARAHLRGVRNPSLQPTALVHELYLRLADSDRLIIRDRAHLLRDRRTGHASDSRGSRPQAARG